jgi:hypothetical protein
MKTQDFWKQFVLNSETHQPEANATDLTTAPDSRRFQKTQERPESFDLVRWFPITAELALAILVCLSILLVRVQDDVYAAIMIGFLFVQILIAAVWTVLAPVNLFFRIASGTSFVAFVCACLFRCAYRDGGGLNIAVAITGAMIVQWLVYQIPLWYLRWTGWQLQAPGQPIANRKKSDFQFGIRHLLIWTTIVGLFMGVARFVAPQFQDATTDLSSVLRLLLVFTLGNSLIVIPILWGCLSRFFWRWSGITIAICILVCVAEAMVMSSDEFFLLVNAVQAAISILAMLAIRWTGYRLQNVTAS